MILPSVSDQAVAGLEKGRTEAAERSRRGRFLLRAKLLSGDVQDLVRDELLKIFSDKEQASRVSLQGDSSLNVFRYVTEELFHYEGAKRCFKVGEEEDAVYQRIDRDIVPFDLVMGEVSVALGALNDVLVMVLPGTVDPVTLEVGLPLIRIFYPHEVTVIPEEDDPSQPREVRYEQLGPDGKTSTVVWNAREHYVADAKGQRQPARGAQDFINPYGRLPFVAVHAGLRSDWFWDEWEGEDRVSFTLQWLAAWSEVRHLMHQQGFFQLVLTGVDETTPTLDLTGPGVQWRVGPGQDIKTVDLHGDPTAHVNALKAMLAGHLASYGLNPERLGMNPGQAPPSGLARFLERQELLERRKRVRPFLEEAEYELAELYRLMWNWNHPEDDRISEEAVFQVELLQEAVVLSPLEQADLRLKQLEVVRIERELGLRSEAEQLAEYNGVSLAIAQKWLAARKAESPPPPAPSPQGEDATS